MTNLSPLYKKITIVLFFLFISTGFIGILIGVDSENFEAREQRKATAFPPLPSNQKTFRIFTEHTESYFSDRILGRSSYLQLYRSLGLTPSPIFTNTYTIAGKNNFYFLGNINNNILDYTKNTKPATQKEIEDKLAFVNYFNEVCKAKNIPFAFLVAPNKATVYPELLPDWFTIKSDFRLTNAIEAKAKENNIPFLFPLKELQEEKNTAQVYYSDDTHWNQLGAYIGLKSLMEELGKQDTSLQVDLSAHIEAVPSEKIGDLLSLGQLPKTEFDPLGYQVILKNFDTESPKIPKKLFLIHDSFGLSWQDTLKLIFEEVVFLHHEELTRENFTQLLDEHKPDVVVIEFVERFFKSRQ